MHKPQGNFEFIYMLVSGPASSAGGADPADMKMLNMPLIYPAAGGFNVVSYLRITTGAA